MPGPTHEVGSSTLGSMFDVKLYEMGLMLQCGRVDSTRYQGRTCGKQADVAWRPYKARPDEKEWPTIVIECGVSQSHNSLVNSARWWLSNSDGEVKNVILIDITKATKKIHIELWESGSVGNRYDLRDRSGPTSVIPRLAQELDIEENRAPSGSLTIKFLDIFLRAPVQANISQDHMTPSELSPSAPSDPTPSTSSNPAPSSEPAPQPAPESFLGPSANFSTQSSRVPPTESLSQQPLEPPAEHPTQPSLDPSAEHPTHPTTELPPQPPTASSTEPPPRSAARPAFIEKDVVFTVQELQEYAEALWNHASYV